jgi:ribosomal protein S18 acetylase RimI-like enzyme
VGGVDEPQLTVARPGPEHAGEALTVQLAAFVREAQRYAAPDIPPLHESAAALRADFARADAPDLVARAAWWGSRLAGSVRGRIVGDRLEVVRLTVAPDLQGLGIGRALLDAVHAAAPPRVRWCWLVTGARTENNIRLYTAAGYRVVGRTVDEVGVDLVRMECRHRP